MKFYLPFFLGILVSFPALSDDSLRQDITSGLAKLIPDVQVDDIQPTPIPGLYQVLLGPDVIYMTRDGNYVIKGELLDISGKRNLTEDVRAGARVKLIDNIDENEYIEFASKNMTDAIYVFTDVDCGYCRKLHLDVPELNARGISVRYLAYPRAGVDSATGNEMISVWCAKDRQKAMTSSKNRESIEEKTCDNPVAKQYQLGRQLGVRGTPAIYLQNGKMLPGYMPPDELIRQVRR